MITVNFVLESHSKTDCMAKEQDLPNIEFCFLQRSVCHLGQCFFKPWVFKPLGGLQDGSLG